MLLYNTQLKKIILPEYGRNIQHMVDYCMTIEDRDERNHCAQTIVDTMIVMFPELRNETDYVHKLWDHLAIMSDFKLDIDYPYEVLREEALETKPEPLHYRLDTIKYRHYGKIIERMIARAAEYPEGEERDALVMLLANHMKKLIYQINNEDVEDSKIFNDLYHYSKGAIRLDPETHRLHEYQVVTPPQPTGKKKKKK
ncbi:MAG: DUF4290 domain-containing protein [Muribaculaceae bacterium]|nr:DUF4290 domain-containing protein [Muribaculaceae bacterium]